MLPTEIQPLGRGPRTWIQRSALYRALQPRLFLLRARLLGREARLLMGDLEGIYADAAIRDSLDWALYAALLERMQRVSRDHGARFLFYSHPDAGEVWEPFIEALCERVGVPRSAHDQFSMERRLAKLAAAHGVPFLPLIDAFLARLERGPFHLLPYDLHLSTAGHRRLAEVLADHLAGSGFAALARAGTAGAQLAAP